VTDFVLFGATSCPCEAKTKNCQLRKCTVLADVLCKLAILPDHPRRRIRSECVGRS